MARIHLTATKINFSITVLLTSLSFCAFHAHANDKLIVATTTEDMRALVEAVGGSNVESFSLAKGTQDPHQLEAKPSFMVKLRNANLVVAQGLDLESAWLDPLIRGSRNTKISAGSPGHLELGQNLSPIEIKSGKISREEGDVHPNGNPHFQLDPIRMGQGAQLVADRLATLDSTHATDYHQRADQFKKMLEEKTKSWQARLAKVGVKEVVTYHKTFSYFADRFNIKADVHLEPKPGIPPTAAHLLEVIEDMKARHIKIVLVENFFDDSAKGKLEQEIPGVKVVKVPVYVGGEPQIRSTDDLIENLVSTIEKASK